MVVQGGQRTIAKAEKPGVDVALVALDALAFNVHLGFCGHDGFDIVGLGQGVHVQIIIHHEQTVLKVSTSKAAGFNFLDAAIADRIAHQVLQHQTDAGFAFTAFAEQEHHLLTFGAGDKAVAEVFLQGRNVLWLQQLIQKGQPAFWLGSFRVIGHRQAVSAEQAAFLKRTVCKVIDAIFESDLAIKNRHTTT
jgi:hypothetical protein